MPVWRYSRPAPMTSASQDGELRGGLPRLSWVVVGVGAIVFAILMALAGRYGFHRDELYFLDAGRHLQGGYVDQPVLGPLLARVSLDLFGVSLVGLRIWPALVAWGTIVVAGLIARECGGGGRAQLLAAAGVATMPVLLAVDHLEGPTSVDVLAWAALALVVLRIGRTRDHRWWLVGGAVLGVGLTNKHSIGIFAVAIVIGALLSHGARDIANRWFFGGAVLAAVFVVPDLVWQAGHGWATVAMTRELNSENGGLGKLPGWVAGQLLMSTLVFVPVWFVGLRTLWQSQLPLWRALAWAYGVLFIVYGVTTGGQIYYLAGAYVYLLAVGAIRLDAWLSGHRARAGLMLAGAIVSTASAVVIVLPLLPAADIGWTYGVNQAPGESIGWPHFVDQFVPHGSRYPQPRGRTRSSSPPTTARPAPSTSSAAGPVCRQRSAVTTTSGGGAPAIPTPRPCSPSRPARSMSPATTHT